MKKCWIASSTSWKNLWCRSLYGIMIVSRSWQADLDALIENKFKTSQFAWQKARACISSSCSWRFYADLVEACLKLFWNEVRGESIGQCFSYFCNRTATLWELNQAKNTAFLLRKIIKMKIFGEKKLSKAHGKALIFSFLSNFTLRITFKPCWSHQSPDTATPFGVFTVLPSHYTFSTPKLSQKANNHSKYVCT